MKLTRRNIGSLKHLKNPAVDELLESNSHHPPGDRGRRVVQIDPRPAWWCAFAGSAKGAGVQYAGQADGFIARDMGMAVKQEVGSSEARRRNV